MIEQAGRHVGEMGPKDSRVLPQEEKSINSVEIVRSLYRGRRTLFVMALGVSALGTAIAFLVPPQFTSRASFIPPNTSNSSSTAALMGQLSQLSGMGVSGMLGGMKSPGDLYVGILKSQTVKSQLVKRFDLKAVYKVKKESQAETLLSRNSEFEVGVKDSIVTISVTDKSPARAQALASGYLDSLREANGRLALSEASQRALFFDHQLAKEKDALADAEVELQKAKERSGLIAPAGQTATEIQIIAQTRAQIASREVTLSSLHQSLTPENPEVIKIQSEIDKLRGQLARLQSGSDKSKSGAIPTSKLPELELDFVRKTREVKYHEALFEMLAKQYEAARMDEARDAPLLQILDAPSYPDTKSSPKRMLIMFSSLILGCLTGSVWVLLRNPIHGIRAFLASEK